MLKKQKQLGGTVIPASSPDDMIAPSSMIIKLRSALSPRMLAFANWRSSQYKKFKVTGNNTGISGVEVYMIQHQVLIILLVLAFKVNDQMNLALGTAKGQSTDDGQLAKCISSI